jgi:hypothetical protein
MRLGAIGTTSYSPRDDAVFLSNAQGRRKSVCVKARDEQQTESEPMKSKETNSATAETAEHERLIRELAHQLWKSEGSPEKRDAEFWDRAKERLEAETHSSYPPTQSRSNRT